MEPKGGPLFYACRLGDLPLAEADLRRGEPVDSLGGYGYSALHHASAFSRIEAVAHLLKNGADVTASGGPLESPIRAAMTYGHVEVVKLLLAAGSSERPQSAKTVQNVRQSCGWWPGSVNGCDRLLPASFG